MSKEANTKKSNKRKHHNKTVLPYFTTPIVFVLISMLVVAPICFGAMHIAIDKVHSAQVVLCKDFNDVEAITEFEASTKKSGSVEIPAIHTAQKIGVIECKNAGLCVDAYYGLNRVSLRNGAALDSDSSLCGLGGVIDTYAYSSKGYKALGSVEVGDVISFKTLWGSYTYKVVEKSVSEKSPKRNDGEYLVMATEADKDAFSSFNKDKLYVVAKMLSGPAAKEVQV